VFHIVVGFSRKGYVYGACFMRYIIFSKPTPLTKIYILAALAGFCVSIAVIISIVNDGWKAIGIVL